MRGLSSAPHVRFIRVRDGPGVSSGPPRPTSPASAADGPADPLPAAADTFRPLAVRRTTRPLIVGAAMIVLLSLLALTAHQNTSGRLSSAFHLLFWYVDVGREYNLATWYGSGLWLALGVLAGAIAASRPARRASWFLLAAVSLLASVDEYLEIHERLDRPAESLAAALPLDLGFTWVLLGAPLALVPVLLLARLVLSLPRPARRALVLGGAVFLAGAIGVETLNGIVLERNDWVVDNRFLYGTMLEELLEMSGIALALGGLLSLLQHDTDARTVRWDPALRERSPVRSAS